MQYSNTNKWAYLGLMLLNTETLLSNMAMLWGQVEKLLLSWNAVESQFLNCAGVSQGERTLMREWRQVPED